MPLFDVRCGNGHVTERRLDHPRTVMCACGQMAQRIWTSPPAVVGPTTDTRGMFRRYQTATQEMDYAASRIEQNTGEAVSTPPLWQMAKQQAAAISAAGEASDFRVKS